MRSFRLNLPVRIILVVAAALILGPYLTVEAKSCFYAISLAIKEILVFVLPVIVFSFLFSCVLSFKDGALKFIICLIAAVCASNFIAVWIGFGITQISIGHISSKLQLIHTHTLEPYFNFSLPRWLPNQYALLLGLVLGLICSYRSLSFAEDVAKRAKWLSTAFLHKIFIPIVPLFIVGFVLKLDYEDVFYTILKSFGPVVLIIILSEIIYLSLLYGIATGFSLKAWLLAIRNVFPSGVMGFATMSSAATMPLTIQGAERNTGNKTLSRAIIPATASIHLVGDGIALPITATVILTTFGLGVPSVSTFALFTVFFVLVKFAVAAVPGGGIIVMVPVLESYLGFTPEMSTLITALYILLDPILTSSNVLGNGAFAILFTKRYATPPSETLN